MKDFWFRLLILWYRLTGSTPTQAEWKARQAASAPRRARAAAQAHVERAGDERFSCVCGTLLVRGAGRCPTCNRRPILPFALRRLARTLGLADSSPGMPGTIFALVTMLVGYVAQLRYGSGGLMNPTPALEALELGASFDALTLGPQPWRAVTYTMLHGGIIHLGFNTMALYQVGPLVEHRFGTSRFLAGWLLGAIVGALAAALISAPGFVVGASGSVFGLIGMAMLQGHREGTTQGRLLRNEMIKWMAITTIAGLMIGGISHSAHFGGLVGGVLVSLALPPSDRHPTRRRMTPGIGLAAAILYIVTFVGFGRWFFGRHVPENATPEAQAMLYGLTANSRGEAAVFGRAGESLLRRIRAGGLDHGDEAQVLLEATTLARDWPPVRRELFLEFVHHELFQARLIRPAAPDLRTPTRAEELQEKPK